jgi:hypothetical protein
MCKDSICRHSVQYGEALFIFKVQSTCSLENNACGLKEPFSFLRAAHFQSQRCPKHFLNCVR